MERIEVKGKLVAIYRTWVSFYGNPSHQIAVETKDGTILRGKTATNGSIGYALENKPGEVRTWEYHVTRGGNVIFDYVY